MGAGAQFLAIHALIRRSSCEYPKVQRGPSHVLTKRLRALQSVRFRAWAGTLVIGSHVLRLAPRVQRISMPRSPLSKIKDQGGCERSVCFHQKLCESRRRAARGCTSCCFPIFVAAYFLHFRFSAWWLSIHINFSTSAAFCAFGDAWATATELRVKNATRFLLGTGVKIVHVLSVAILPSLRFSLPPFCSG